MKNAHESAAVHYLLNGPLPIDPLVEIFEIHTTNPAMVPDADVRAQRRAQAIAEWDQEKAQAAQADKEKDDEHKDDKE